MDGWFLVYIGMRRTELPARANGWIEEGYDIDWEGRHFDAVCLGWKGWKAGREVDRPARLNADKCNAMQYVPSIRLNTGVMLWP